jgi:hypothetical protein
MQTIKNEKKPSCSYPKKEKISLTWSPNGRCGFYFSRTTPHNNNKKNTINIHSFIIML